MATVVGAVGCGASAEATAGSDVAALEQTAADCSANQGIRYGVTDLGTLATEPGDTFTTVGRLNDRAEVVGVSDFKAFSWQNGRMTALATLSDNGATYAHAVNNTGLIVGGSSTSDFHLHAVSWRNGEPTDLGPGEAYDVNDRGHIVGYASVASSDRLVHAFIYKNGAMNDLGTLGGESSFATAVNERSQAVGYSRFPSGATFAAFWHEGQAEAFAGVDAVSIAWDINDRGQIVGEIGDGLAQRAFVYQHGELTDIGAPGAVTRAFGINNRGVVVGVTTHDEPERWELEGGSEGFVKMGDSFELLRHLTDGCWNLLTPIDVNERGQISAIAYPCDGELEEHPLLLSPEQACPVSAPRISR